MEKRTPSNKTWIEQRSIGRRDADRGVCIYHDICHETVAGIKQTCIEHKAKSHEEFEKLDESITALGSSKLDRRIFILFVSTLISICIAVGVVSIPQLFKLTSIVSKIDTNQRHLMEEFQIQPLK